MRISTLALCGLLLLTRFAAGQVNIPVPSRTGTASGPPPVTDVRLTEVPFEKLSDQRISPVGQEALKIDPKRWKHAETPHFILHYRRATEAQKVAREIEFTLWWVATQLSATPDRYAKRSHVYIFEDDEEWKQFRVIAEMPNWSLSVARGDELFLNVRESSKGRFNFETLAHETAHAVVARLYPRERWPLWLNEGFAEYAAGASIAARRNQTTRRHQETLQYADLPLGELFQMDTYSTGEKLSQQYQTAEKFVRFLHNELPRERFILFVDEVLKGTNPKEAVLKVYRDQFKDWEAFQKRFDRFKK